MRGHLRTLCKEKQDFRKCFAWRMNGKSAGRRLFRRLQVILKKKKSDCVEEMDIEVSDGAIFGMRFKDLDKGNKITLGM